MKRTIRIGYQGEHVKRKSPRTIGITAGAGASAYRYRSVSPTIAGGIGGGVGATIPDWLETATTPNHRNLDHSWATAGVVTSTAAGLIRNIDEYASS